jgi:hypothetical protein
MQIQESIFPAEQLPPRIRYEKLFSRLPALKESTKRRGRPPVSRNAILRSLIHGNLRRFATLGDLVFELENNPSIFSALGFSPLDRVPSVERFSSFHHDTPNELLQEIRQALVAMLLDKGVVKGDILTLDSCPIVVSVKENNPKTSLGHNRFDKHTPPRGDPDARLGILCHYPARGNKKVSYFWGYRNHVLSDAITELPLEEVTHSANVSELHPARKFLKWAFHTFHTNVKAVTGDAEFDVEDILEFIFHNLKAMPVIPHNPRNEQNIGYTIKNRTVFCEADLPMVHRGKMTVKTTTGAGITYRQYSCSLHWRKSIAQQYLFCPALHPKFFKQKGCNILIRLTPTIRSQIDYDSRIFKELYNKRPNVERIFSRLLSITAQNPTVKGLTAIRNHVTIAHITVLLVALAAHREGHEDKLRYVRYFVPNFLK